MSTSPTDPKQPTFWERHFELKPTPEQIAFDIAFGIALPLLCLYLDPIVFRAKGSFGEPLLGRHAVLAYAAIGLGLLQGAIVITRIVRGTRPAA